MDTAASTGSGFADGGSNDGYAIPIGTATTLASQILSGRSSATVHVGGTPLLGVQVADASGGQTAGATVAGVVPGGPAAKAGLVPGDVVTGVGSTAVTSASGLTRLIVEHRPGDRITLAYSDANGSHSVSVTLGSGPPQ
jgi:S1-C subfamily serine protease